MFWHGKNKTTESTSRPNVTFENAKEATRRAAFLNVAQGMTDDEEYRRQLRELFNTCRSVALTAGAAEGRSNAEIDGEISALCDADTVRLKNASDEEFRSFVYESGEVVKRFLSAI